MIHIAFNIDNNYVQHCAVTMVSLFKNNPEEQFTIHIVSDGLADEGKTALCQLAESYRSTVRYYSPDPEALKGFTIRKFSKRISMATYYRCILADLLPQNLDKVLYLDCDIVVTGNISPFWNTPIDHTGVAAVEDTGCREAQRYEILQYPMQDSYFNAGVLLINLDYWRRHQVGQACISYFHTYPERILFNDQDLLNSILHDQKELVGLEWNVQDGFYRNTTAFGQEWHKDHAHVLKHPTILHYTNRKPWNYDSQHPLRNLYFDYLDLTPWKGVRPDKNLKNRLKRFFRLLPFYTGLRKPKYINLASI